MKHWLYLMLLFLVPFGLSGTMLPSGKASTQQAAAASPWDARHFTNATVVDQNGKSYRFWDDVLKDQLVVINFMFTGCSQICPLTTARLSEVRAELGEAAGAVRFVSISVDPLNDTPAAMRKFADGFRIAPGWLFLTGEPDELAVIRDKLGERSREKTQHQSILILANTRTGEWKKDSSMSEIAHLVRNIRDLDPQWRQSASQLAARAENVQPFQSVENVTGQMLFQKACSNCHSIGKGDKIGPDLAGVTKRRPREWLTRYIQRPDLLRELGDPTAVALYEQYRQVAMPNLQLNETDAADVLSYIERATLSAHAPSRSGSATD